MNVRVMDSWVHEQDVRVATGRPGHDSGPAAQLSLDRLCSAMPFVVGKQARAPEGASVRFDLRGRCAYASTLSCRAVAPKPLVPWTAVPAPPWTCRWRSSGASPVGGWTVRRLARQGSWASAETPSWRCACARVHGLHDLTPTVRGRIGACDGEITGPCRLCLPYARHRRAGRGQQGPPVRRSRRGRGRPGARRHRPSPGPAGASPRDPSGKVPRQVLEARLGGATALRQQALSDALPDLYARAVVDTELDPIAAPEIDIKSGEDEGPVTFDAVVEIRPTVSIAGYGGLQVTLPTIEVGDDEVRAQVDRLHSDQSAELTSVGRPARVGDHVSIDMHGTRPAGRGPARGGLPLRDRQRRGDRRSRRAAHRRQARSILQFSAPVRTDDTEEEAQIRVLVKDVKEKVLTELSDQWATEASEFETLQALEDDLPRSTRPVQGGPGPTGAAGAHRRSKSGKMRIKAITNSANRRTLIGGSDARIIMGQDEEALLRLWSEKRGEVEPEDLSGNLIVQLGAVTEDLNRRWFEAKTGQLITDVQRQIWHPALPWMAATLDGRVQGQRGRIRGQVHAALVVLGRSRSRKVCATAAA